MDPFINLGQRAQVSLPPLSEWQQDSGSAPHAFVRIPWERSQNEGAPIHAKILAQWAISQRRRPAPALSNPALILTCSCEVEYEDPQASGPLALARPPDVSAKWTFVSGRCTDQDILPGAGSRFIAYSASPASRVRVWDHDGRLVAFPTRARLDRTLHTVGATDPPRVARRTRASPQCPGARRGPPRPARRGRSCAG